MNKQFFFSICIALLMVTSGCVVERKVFMPQTEKVVTRIVERNAIESECGGLLIYYDSLTRMSEKALEKEKIITRKNLTDPGNNCDQLRFVLFSLLPESDAKNGKEVASILKGLASRKESLHRDERQLLELLSDQLELKSRLRERLNYCDLRMKSLDSALSEAQIYSGELRQELNEVELKLEKLKSIDEKHNAREQEVLIKSKEGLTP